MSEALVSLKKIKLGGLDQFIYLRTKNIENPILLYLHGGPGNPIMDLFRKKHKSLENHFIVVQWEQRGAGKSYSNKISKESMNIEQFLSDLKDLIKYLREKFNKKKIFLMGHSWGSFLGILAIKKYPELFHAYIGVGQLFDMVENEKLSYKLTLKKAYELNDQKAISELKTIGEPFKGMNPPYNSPYKRGYKSRICLFYWMYRFGGIFYNVNYHKNYKGYLKSLLKIKFLFYFPFLHKEYSFIDKYKIVVGGTFSMKTMTKEILNVNLFNNDIDLKVPVFFVMGRHDLNTPYLLVKKYFNKLNAPYKELFCFEKSAHMADIEESEKFNDLLINHILAKIIRS